MRVKTVSVFFLIPLPAVWAAAANVSNRAPAESDISYLPADGPPVRTNPSALGWLLEPGARKLMPCNSNDTRLSRAG